VQGHPEFVSGSARRNLNCMKLGYVYIMSNIKRTTFYIGVTSDLEEKVRQHKAGMGSIFTSKYKLYDLVYFERIFDIEQAIKREKQLKRWYRNWKINLIKSINPEMLDLINIGLPADTETSSA
jgi:putative endonuclease